MSARWSGLVLMALLNGCASGPHPSQDIPPPPLPVVQEAAEAPTEPAAPIPAEERPRFLASEPAWLEGPPLQVVTRAAKLATVKPALQGFDRGMLVYPYRPYAVYRLDVPMRGAVHIQLQTGEEIRLAAGYRTSDWTVQRDDARTPLERSHLTVTPTPHDVDEPVHGQMVLVTSLGVYYLDLHSQHGIGLFGVSWRHPGKGAP